jgi:precorrin-2/cobalt-factor-2 C20-methyltransferase
LKKQDIKENNMQGKIYGIGVGPGDLELMTLKAVRLIREVDVIAIPGKEKETCTAYQIALGAVPEIDEKEIIPVVFPMTKNESVLKESHEAAVKSLSALMDQGKTVAFLTLGDVTVYSTYGYVHKKLLALGYESVLINGVPSFCAAAAKLGISLGEKAESIHILPGSYPVKDGLKLSGTKILMKSGKKIADVKRELLLTECPAWMVENCGMEGERLIRSAADIPEDAGYYSLIIAKDREEQ